LFNFGTKLQKLTQSTQNNTIKSFEYNLNLFGGILEEPLTVLPPNLRYAVNPRFFKILIYWNHTKDWSLTILAYTKQPMEAF